MKASDAISIDEIVNGLLANGSAENNQHALEILKSCVSAYLMRERFAPLFMALTLTTNERNGGTDTRFAPTFDGDVERWADWHFAFTAYMRTAASWA